MTWAQRRKLTIVMLVLLVLATALSLVVRQATKVAPTCYDKKQNQGEVGVDCGGPCTFYCVGELQDPKVRWVRTFDIRPGIVHAVAYIEHTYPTAAARQIRYSFKLYDENNTLIQERTGSTFLGTMGRTAIVETLIKTGTVKPAIVRFSTLPPLPWEKIPGAYSQVVLKTDRTLLESQPDLTRVTATIENTSRISFRDVHVVAILYDKDDNAVNASQALLLSLPGESSQTVTFTWPFVMPVPISRIEIIPRANPFTSSAL
jgi:hypothetical protein